MINSEGAAGPRELVKQFAKMWLLDLLEPTGAIFSGVVPRVGRGTDERADRRVIAKLHPPHGDYLVYDGGKLAGRAAPFHLKPVLGSVKVVSDGLKDPEKDDVDRTRLLQVH